MTFSDIQAQAKKFIEDENLEGIIGLITAENVAVVNRGTDLVDRKLTYYQQLRDTTPQLAHLSDEQFDDIFVNGLTQEEINQQLSTYGLVTTIPPQWPTSF